MNKRRFARQDASSTVFFALPDREPLGEAALAGFSDQGDGSLTDISSSGFHAKYLDESKLRTVTPGQQINFRFHIATGLVEGSATVEWINSEASEMGLQFDRITNDQGRKVLQRYLSSLFLGVEPPD